MPHLLAISIGPVQDFIAAARRTADLQAGSELLVNVAQHVARTLHGEGASLIFPADLENDGPNKILAEIPDGVDPNVLASKAEEAARDLLRQQWNGVQTRLTPGMRAALDDTLADAQIATFLEFYAAWLPLKPDCYADTRQKLDRLLAGRKALRDFRQPQSATGRPKSPLDPSRDCAFRRLRDGFKVPAACTRHPLWLKPNETLDAVSLLKRVNGVNSTPQTPSTSLMAARAILPTARLHDEEAIKKLEQIVRTAGASIDMGDMLFLNRLDDEIAYLANSNQEGKASQEEESRTLDRKQTILQYLVEQRPEIVEMRARILQAAGFNSNAECPPYYAILAADGDRMGKLLNQLKTIKEHREFSTTLSNFAVWAKEYVPRVHHGHVVYGGGDDVLALLPVNTAIACAAALAAEFQRRLDGVRAHLKLHTEEVAGTLSAGIAIVHHMDPLQVGLERARQAEHAAKNSRNALAVALHTRGGEPRTVTAEWSKDEQLDPRHVWENLTKALTDELARGFPYELRSLAREWRGTDIPKDRLEKRLRDEAKRILRRKLGIREGESTFSLELLSPLIDRLKTPADLEAFANQLVIARFLASNAPRTSRSLNTANDKEEAHV